MRKFLFWAFIVICATAAGPAWAADKEVVLAEISTRAGKVLLVEEGDERRFVFKENVLQKGTVFMDVHRFFRPRKGYDGLLIRDFSGPIYCPTRFRFLTFRPDGSNSLTEPFGHCDAAPEMKLKGTIITIRFKAFGAMPAETWTYDGTTLKKEKPAEPAT